MKSDQLDKTLFTKEKVPQDTNETIFSSSSPTFGHANTERFPEVALAVFLLSQHARRALPGLYSEA